MTFSSQKNYQITPLKPLLKWAGGKRWLLPLLTELWPTLGNTPWVEPFAGGMAIALGLQPKQALLNDINVHLINFYQHIKQGLKTRMVCKNEETFYYDRRAEFNALIQRKRFRTAKAAALFYYLIKTGFNGLCRFNRSGIFNVPFGQHKHITYRRDFTAYQPWLTDWQFFAQDFETLPLTGKEVIYADPPYDATFTHYYSTRFEWADQYRLAAWLAAHPGPVIASNQATQRMVALYEALGFRIVVLPAPRRISCTGDRSPAAEMLAFKGISERQLKHCCLLDQLL